MDEYLKGRLDELREQGYVIQTKDHNRRPSAKRVWTTSTIVSIEGEKDTIETGFPNTMSDRSIDRLLGVLLVDAGSPKSTV